METAQFGNVFFHGSNFGNYTFCGVKKSARKKRRKEEETKQTTTTTKSKNAREISILRIFLVKPSN